MKDEDDLMFGYYGYIWWKACVQLKPRLCLRVSPLSQHQPHFQGVFLSLFSSPFSLLLLSHPSHSLIHKSIPLLAISVHYFKSFRNVFPSSHPILYYIPSLLFFTFLSSHITMHAHAHMQTCMHTQACMMIHIIQTHFSFDMSMSCLASPFQLHA